MDVFVSFIILAAIVAVSFALTKCYLLLLGILTGISIYHNLGVFVDAFGQ